MELAPGTIISARGLLFDMDGTLVDSGAATARVYRRFAARHGQDAEKMLNAIVGCRAEDSIARFARPGTDLATENARILAEELEDVADIVPIPGAAALLAALPADAWALVTSASRELAARRMGAAGLPLPAAMVTGELVALGKPAPDCFLAGARALGCAAADCLAFEDALSGLRAAHAAGNQVLAVASRMRPQDLAGEHWLADFTRLRFQGRREGILTFVVQG